MKHNTISKSVKIGLFDDCWCRGQLKHTLFIGKARFKNFLKDTYKYALGTVKNMLNVLNFNNLKSGVRSCVGEVL